MAGLEQRTDATGYPSAVLPFLTGTGKTLSLICGTLKWLEEKKEADAKTSQPDAQNEQGMISSTVSSKMIIGFDTFVAEPFTVANFAPGLIDCVLPVLDVFFKPPCRCGFHACKANLVQKARTKRFCPTGW